MSSQVLVPAWEHTAFLLTWIIIVAVALSVLIGVVWALCQRDDDWFY